MKIQELYNIKPALDELFAAKPKAKVAFRVARAIKAIDAVLEDFGKTEKALFEQYGEECTENGEQILKVPPENLEVFNAERLELLNEDIELTFTKIPENLVEEIDISISSALSLMDVMFIEAEKEG